MTLQICITLCSIIRIKKQCSPIEILSPLALLALRNIQATPVCCIQQPFRVLFENYDLAVRELPEKLLLEVEQYHRSTPRLAQQIGAKFQNCKMVWLLNLCLFISTHDDGFKPVFRNASTFPNSALVPSLSISKS